MSRSRPIAWVLLGLGLLVVACLLFLQTGAGFRGVIVPLVSGFVPGTLEVGEGRFGLGGTLMARGLRFESAELGVTAAVEELDADVAVLSLLGSKPRVEMLRVRGAEVDLVPPEAEPDDGEDEEESGAERLLERIRSLPVEVEAADLETLRLRREVGEGDWMELRVEHLRASELVAGGSGTIELAAASDVALEDEGEAVAYSGELELEAELGQDGDGLVERWKLTSLLAVRPRPEGTPVRFSLDVEGGVEGQRIESRTRLRGERGDAVLGAVEASLAAEPGTDGGDLVSAQVQLESLSEAFLNPLIAPLGRGQIQRARIGGSLEAVAELPEGDAPPQLRKAEGEFSVPQLDYRTLQVADANARLAATPGSLKVELLPTRVGRGRVSATLSRQLGADQERLEARANTSRLDLTAIANAFREDLPRSVEGVLDLSAHLHSEAPPDAEILESVDGVVDVDLANGRIQGFNLMSFLAASSGVEAFKAIPLDNFGVDAVANVADGVAHLEEASVTSAAAELIVNGQIRLTGSMDLTVEAFVGPSVAGSLKRVGLDLPTFEQVQRMASVPVAVRVHGPFDALDYGPTTPRTAERTDAVVEAGADSVQEGAKQVEKGAKRVVDWLRR